MVSRITRLLLLLQLIALLGLAWMLHGFGITSSPASSLLLGAAIVLVVRFAIVLNNFLLSAAYRSPLPAPQRPDSLQYLRLVFGEYLASMWSSSFTMPFQAFDKRVLPQSSSLPVLLVHGYGCNSGYWVSMSKALAGAGVTHYAIDLAPVLGSIDDYAPLLEQAIGRTCAETGHDQVILVAHSMGGLAARAWLRKYGGARIARVITLGTPHNGTMLARFGVGENVRQMRWTPHLENGRASDWLQCLQQGESSRDRALFMSIYSHHDNIIAPQTSSRLAGAANVALRGIGHVSLALNSKVQQVVIEEILRVSRETLPGNTQAAAAP